MVHRERLTPKGSRGTRWMTAVLAVALATPLFFAVAAQQVELLDNCVIVLDISSSASEISDHLLLNAIPNGSVSIFRQRQSFGRQRAAISVTDFPIRIT